MSSVQQDNVQNPSWIFIQMIKHLPRIHMFTGEAALMHCFQHGNLSCNTFRKENQTPTKPTPARTLHAYYNIVHTTMDAAHIE